jgi:hypothetical protein
LASFLSIPQRATFAASFLSILNLAYNLLGGGKPLNDLAGFGITQPTSMSWELSLLIMSVWQSSAR